MNSLFISYFKLLNYLCLKMDIYIFSICTMKLYDRKERILFYIENKYVKKKAVSHDGFRIIDSIIDSIQ